MTRVSRTALSILLASAALATAQAQTIAAPDEEKTLAATMNVYVFPAEGQSREEQNRHEAECYAWAVENTKSDPFELAKRAEEQAKTAEQQKAAVAEKTRGAGARGALAGAAAGALIGEIADDDAGGGAVAGGAIGLLAARRKARRGRQQATQRIDQQTQQTRAATAEQVEGFKKAFSVCLEAKKYMVKL